MLSEGRAAAASSRLRELSAAGAGESSELALAACALIDGDVDLGVAKCREIIDAGGPYAIAASLLLRRSVPGAIDAEENDRWAGLLAQRHPLSYDAVLARRLPAAKV